MNLELGEFCCSKLAKRGKFGSRIEKLQIEREQDLKPGWVDPESSQTVGIPGLLLK